MEGSYNNSSSLLDGLNAKPLVPSPSDFTQSDNDTSHQPLVDAVNAQSEVNAVHDRKNSSQSNIHVEGSGRIVGSATNNAEFDLMFNDELYNFFDDESSGSRDFSFDLDYLSTMPHQKQEEESLYSQSRLAVSNAAAPSPSVLPQVPKPSQPSPPSVEAKEGALIWHNAVTDKQHRESMIILM
jgi:hypothetical protein